MGVDRLDLSTPYAGSGCKIEADCCKDDEASKEGLILRYMMLLVGWLGPAMWRAKLALIAMHGLAWIAGVKRSALVFTFTELEQMAWGRQERWLRLIC